MVWPPATHQDVEDRLVALRSSVGGSSAVDWSTVYTETAWHTAVVTETASLRSALGGTAVNWPPDPHQDVVDELDALWSITNPAALVYPADAGVVNVKAAPYNAAGDGIADDTAALTAAFNDYDWVEADTTNNPALGRMASRTVYLPAGTYRVTNILHIVGCSVRVAGAGKDLTTIKLANSAAGYGSAGSPKYLFRTGHAQFPQNTDWNQDNSGFGNYLQDLTLDIGSNNPGAVGIRYSVANAGAMERVRIRSSDPAKLGKYGMDFEHNPGPALVNDVEIDGFDTGIHGGTYPVNNITFTNITLKNQKVQAILSEDKAFEFENLTVTNAPVAFTGTTNRASLILIDSTLGGTGTGPAINTPTDGFVYLRDVTCTGFANIVTTGSTARFVGKSAVNEWSTLSYRRGDTVTAWTETNAHVTPRIPNTPTPTYQNTDLSKWASVVAFGATPNDDTNDDTPAFLAAINSGAAVVYCPYGRYAIKSDLIIDSAAAPNFRMLDGMFSVWARGSSGIKIVVRGTGSNPIHVENSSTNLTVQQDGASPVVFRNLCSISGPGLVHSTGANATGMMFVQNSGSNSSCEVTRPIVAHLRQWNRERQGYLTASGGAQVRCFGHNIEEGASDAPMSQTLVSGAGTVYEMLGGAYDVLNPTSTEWPTSGIPAHDVSGGAKFAYVMVGDNEGAFGTIDYWGRDMQGGNTYLLQNVHVVLGDLNGRRRVAYRPYSSP